MTLRAIALASGMALLALVSAPCAAEVRTWTDKTGKFKIEAEFVEVAGDSVRLRKADGKVISVPRTKLSDGDERFVQQFEAKKSSSPANAKSDAPENSILRLDVPYGRGRTTACAFALSTSDSPTLVISDRNAIGILLDDAQKTKGFADAAIFQLQTSKKLTAGSTVAFFGRDGITPTDNPGGGVVVLRPGQKIDVAPLKLAAESPNASDVLLIPKFSKPSASGQKASAKGKAADIEWTKWNIKERVGSSWVLQIEGEPYRPIGGAPVLNQRHEVVGIAMAMGIKDDDGSRSIVRSWDDLDAAIKKAKETPPK
jgi:hypothetical protein